VAHLDTVGVFDLGVGQNDRSEILVRVVPIDSVNQPGNRFVAAQVQGAQQIGRPRTRFRRRRYSDEIRFGGVRRRQWVRGRSHRRRRFGQSGFGFRAALRGACAGVVGNRAVATAGTVCGSTATASRTGNLLARPFRVSPQRRPAVRMQKPTAPPLPGAPRSRPPRERASARVLGSEHPRRARRTSA